MSSGRRKEKAPSASAAAVSVAESRYPSPS
jgi:hypothetical protein